MTFQIISSAEVGRTGVWGAAVYTGPGPRTCYRCGLSPVEYVQGNKKANPSIALLQPAGPAPNDPLLRSRYECRERSACDTRRRHRDRQTAGAENF